MNKPLPTLRASAISNYVGQGWSALMSIAFLPLYLAALGVEAYALIGVFAVLQAWMAVLDLGLTPTLNREMARLRAGAHTGESIRDLLRSLEVVCGALTAITIVVLWTAAPSLSSEWLRVQGLDEETATRAIRLMAFVLATRFFEQIYRSALQGAHDQIWLNAATALLATLRWGGAYLVIRHVAPTVGAFFVCHGAVSIAGTAILIHRTYHILPAAGHTGRFRFTALREVYGFARGMFVGSILAFILTQSDKLAVSKLLPLSQLGYYTLASTVAAGLMQLVMPLTTAILPRLTMDVAGGTEDALRRKYHAGCEWMAAIVVPPALVLAFFPEFVLWSWSGNAELVAAVAPLLRVLALGQLANALVNMPYMLQLAHGWTNLAVRINSIAVVLFVPLVVWAVPRYGGVGAATVWLALNLGYLLIGAALMHRRVLTGSSGRWYRDAVLLPLIIGAAMALLLRLALPADLSRGSAGVAALGAGAMILLGVALVLPAVRHWAGGAVSQAYRVLSQ